MKLTKGEKKQIEKLHDEMALKVQNFFSGAFNLKKVDKEYLEININDNLIELRIAGMPNSIYLSIGLWKEDHIFLYQGSDIEQCYLELKKIFKQLR